MLPELNTPGWERAFEHSFARKLRITREDVKEIVHMVVPDHATEPGFCKMLCDCGYLAVFKMKEDWFAALEANCDGSTTGHNFVVADDYEMLLSMLSPYQRGILGLETAADRELTEGYADA